MGEIHELFVLALSLVWFVGATPDFWVRKVAEQKLPEFFEFSFRILPRFLLRSFPECFEEFSCFVLWETATSKKFTKNPRHFSMQNSQVDSKRKSTKVFWRVGKVTYLACHVPWTYPVCPVEMSRLSCGHSVRFVWTYYTGIRFGTSRMSLGLAPKIVPRTLTRHTDHRSEPIFGKGMRRSTFQWKKGFLAKKGGGSSVNEAVGKDLYREGSSVKSSGRFSDPPDSENMRKSKGMRKKNAVFFRGPFPQWETNLWSTMHTCKVGDRWVALESLRSLLF